MNTPRFVNAGIVPRLFSRKHVPGKDLRRNERAHALLPGAARTEQYHSARKFDDDRGDASFSLTENDPAAGTFSDYCLLQNPAGQ